MLKKKRRIVLLCVMLLIAGVFVATLTGCSNSNKIPIPTVEEGVFVYDEDDIIDDEVEGKINDMLVDLEEKTEVEFAVMTVEDLQGWEIEDYANNLFNTLGIGKKGEDNGLLLLISRPDERVRIEVGRGLEGCLNDAKCGRILDDYFVPYRESDEYTKGTELTAQAILNVLADEYDVQIQGVSEDLQVQEEETDDFKWVEITLIVIMIILVTLRFVISLIGDDDDYHGGGIFFGGGGSSGGSFGGGFSGGGGASR